MYENKELYDTMSVQKLHLAHPKAQFSHVSCLARYSLVQVVVSHFDLAAALRRHLAR